MSVQFSLVTLLCMHLNTATLRQQISKLYTHTHTRMHI